MEVLFFFWGGGLAHLIFRLGLFLKGQMRLFECTLYMTFNLTFNILSDQCPLRLSVWVTTSHLVSDHLCWFEWTLVTHRQSTLRVWGLDSHINVSDEIVPVQQVNLHILSNGNKHHEMSMSMKSLFIKQRKHLIKRCIRNRIITDYWVLPT